MRYNRRNFQPSSQMLKESNAIITEESCNLSDDIYPSPSKGGLLK